MGLFGFALSYLLFAVLHFFQFVMGLVVIGLYGTDLDNARKAGKYADGKWVSDVLFLTLAGSSFSSLLFTNAHILGYNLAYSGITGLRCCRRSTLFAHGAPLLCTLHPAICPGPCLELNHVHSLVCSLWHFRQDVYPRERRRRRWHYSNEECGLGRSHKFDPLALGNYRPCRLLVGT